MKVCIGADHAGFALKELVASSLRETDIEVTDVGTNSPDSVDYPVYALRVARAVERGQADRGILVCGSGTGMCIAANRIPGVRAVNGHEPFEARMSRRHNDSNVLCLGSRFIGVDLALEIVREWIKEPFEGGRHKRRIDLIDNPKAE
ncbi:MAG TPA: ribose 5-phosphate isomerase B [Deltaproteobacteria bacterium]|jgi:ribose 5-phosphate isomerase B|nr:ribose 5-phosphate isomerase B [Deltaproteobacteria bacterium]